MNTRGARARARRDARARAREGMRARKKAHARTRARKHAREGLPLSTAWPLAVVGAPAFVSRSGWGPLAWRTGEPETVPAGGAGRTGYGPGVQGGCRVAVPTLQNDGMIA